uniref:Uncharacterized protein n=1 Tax=Arundo donax TaxID=35708 RepID=A0A0A9E0T5_ARUDO
MWGQSESLTPGTGWHEASVSSVINSEIFRLFTPCSSSLRALS